MLDDSHQETSQVQMPAASCSAAWGRRCSSNSGQVPTLVTRAALRRMLGGPQAMPEGCNEEVGDDLCLIRVQLEPGDVLYAQGARPTYAYIVESGLIQCERERTEDERSPDAVSYAAAHDLFGHQVSQRQRREGARAITRATLLALPVDDLQDMEARSPLLAELIARPRGHALIRDWRMVYRLRDLPPYARTVAGLSHLIGLAKPGRDPVDPQATLQVVIDVQSLRRWLGLTAEDLDKSLVQLQRYGALVRRKDQIISLVPEVMLQVSDALRPWRKQAPERPQKSTAGLALVSVLLVALTATLLGPAEAEAGTNAVRHAVGGVAGTVAHPVPWGFVLFCGVVLMASHLRLKRG